MGMILDLGGRGLGARARLEAGGILQALGGPEARLTGGKPAAILHFDAHIDAYHNLDHFLGARKSAAHWGAYLADQGQVDPKRSMQIASWSRSRSPCG